MADKMIMILNLITLVASSIVLIFSLRICRLTAARLAQIEEDAERIRKATEAATGRMEPVVMPIRVPDGFQREALRLHVMEEGDLPDFPNGN